METNTTCINNLSESELKRIKEIHFYLLFKSLRQNTDKIKNNFKDPHSDFIYTISECLGINNALIEIAFSILNKPANKPTKKELAIYAYYFNFPKKYIFKNLMNKNTYYLKINDYIDSSKLHPILEERFEQPIDILLKGLSDLYLNFCNLLIFGVDKINEQ